MKPATLNLEFTAGDDFVFEFDWEIGDEAVILTGKTLEMHIKKRKSDATPLAIATEDIQSPNTGEVRFIMTDEETQELMPQDKIKSRFFYDVQVTHEDGIKDTLLKGTFIGEQGVTS